MSYFGVNMVVWGRFWVKSRDFRTFLGQKRPISIIFTLFSAVIGPFRDIFAKTPCTSTISRMTQVRKENLVCGNRSAKVFVTLSPTIWCLFTFRTKTCWIWTGWKRKTRCTWHSMHKWAFGSAHDAWYTPHGASRKQVITPKVTATTTTKKQIQKSWPTKSSVWEWRWQLLQSRAESYENEAGMDQAR